MMNVLQEEDTKVSTGTLVYRQVPVKWLHRNFSIGQRPNMDSTLPDLGVTVGISTPVFFGLAVIPCDTCNSSCKERIVYCCGPTCYYSPSGPNRPDTPPTVC